MRHLNSVAILVAVSAAVVAAEPQNIPVSQLGREYQLVGKLHAPLGKYITVEGVVVEGPYKGFEGGPNLRPQRIQGRAIQEDIQIVIRPYFNDWGKEAFAGSGKEMPKLEMGKTYRMEGHETGGYFGTPAESYEKAGAAIQTTGHYFRTEFVVVKAEQIEPLAFGPADFEGQKALLQGRAANRANRAILLGQNWIVVVDPMNRWPEHAEGKLVETYGLYNPSSDRLEYTLADGEWRLVRLEDQLGRTVTLRGMARSLNDVWWFHYRGTDLNVENMTLLPGWTADNHWRPMVICGILEKAKLPHLDQVSEKPDRDLTEQYIVRKASWQPLPSLLSPERPIDEEP